MQCSGLPTGSWAARPAGSRPSSGASTSSSTWAASSASWVTYSQAVATASGKVAGVASPQPGGDRRVSRERRRIVPVWCCRRTRTSRPRRPPCGGTGRRIPSCRTRPAGAPAGADRAAAPRPGSRRPVRRRLPPEQRADHAQALVESRPALLEGHPDSTVVLGRRSRAETRDHRAVREHRERGDRLGQHDRMPDRRQRDAGRQGHPAGAAGNARERGGAVQPRSAPHEVVVRGHHGEAELGRLSRVGPQLSAAREGPGPGPPEADAHRNPSPRTASTDPVR